MIRNAKITDAKQIVDIYNYYVLNSVVTFDEVPFSEADFKTRIVDVSSRYPFIVYQENSKILGYAYANMFRQKPAYKNSVETTIYLAKEAQGKQIGTKLYSALLNLLKAQKYHVAIGGLTLPNEASVKLHEKLGFKQVAHFKEVGFKFNKWLDVGFWELILD
ncbi:GNAT family N-acetyltransferase [Flavobacteriaceae bacterium XHP0103]|uniref:GNAT family N-acetyltransferase n=1 Tax=Marixanthotalea marina TaxID=2844359 RepID=UPI002989B266|nr:GNAT family N-acetyltransferase [Marixanthotalea marina]MBU3822708.1 GNAT family N-acetyltransferase [Marixanthotalea marina]